jgi:hypothetical protein
LSSRKILACPAREVRLKIKKSDLDSIIEICTRKKYADKIAVLSIHTDAGGTRFVAFCYFPCTQEDTNDNEKKEVYLIKYKMVSK